MTKKSGFAFEFEIPDGWGEFREGSSHIFQGPLGEVLIVSGHVIEGGVAGPELAGARRRLFQNAVESVNSAAAHPELKVTRPLGPDEGSPGVGRWRLSCRTADGEALFEQAIFLNERAVLLVTFEAPEAPLSHTTYARFLQSVDSLPT